MRSHREVPLLIKGRILVPEFDDVSPDGVVEVGVAEVLLDPLLQLVPAVQQD